MQLPIGYDDFGKVTEKNLNYVDKSGFVIEVLDDTTTESIVITRPRRFGKTSNLSLLHYFLSPEVMGKSTKGMFDHLKIAQYGDEYMQHQGKYPVIFVTFKDVKQLSFRSALDKLNELIIALYDTHNYLENSDKLTSAQKELYAIVLRRNANQSQLEGALQKLIEYLSIHHGVNAWLLIDEYDTPIQSAYSKGYYDEMIEFMRGMFGAALKNNPYLNRAVITGILRIAKESLFSGVNNLKVYSILHPRYSEHFGFTESEVDYILTQTQLSDKAAEIKQWYNGYRFGETTIYNPWSIANCVNERGDMKPYWVDTSDNQLIKDLMKKTPLSFKAELEGLVTGRPVEKIIDEQLSFQYLDNNPDALWNLLLMAGYLSPSHSSRTDQGVLAALAIPNHEVRNLYRQIIEQWLSDGYGVNWYNEFITALLNGNIEKFKTYLEKVLSQIVSCHDFAKEPEAFYHGLLLGFMVSLNQTHEIKSNRESGLGRYDIILIPKEITKFGIVIELKAKRAEEMCSLDSLAEGALKQIDEKHYTAEFEQRQITNIIKIGIGFYRKQFALQYVLVS
jgi:hypothetical protein